MPAGLVPPLFLPAPTLILSDGWEMLSSGELHENILASLSRIIVGYGIGAVSGILIGLILAFRAGQTLYFRLWCIPFIRFRKLLCCL